MPVLKEYAESNDKDGYYVHAPISNLDYPLPLQTSDVTKKIYQELGYKPRRPGSDGGIDVPNELTWTLYNVGLHWTEKSGPKGDPSDLDPDQLRDEAGPDLTNKDIQTIISFAEDYEGRYQSQVRDLRNEFADESDKASIKSNTGDGTPSPFQQILEGLSNKPSFDDNVEKLIEQWEPQNVVDDDHEPENEFSGFLLTPLPEHREALSSVPNLRKRLQELSSHPWKVTSVRGIDPRSDGDAFGLKVTFQTETNSEIKSWSSTDYRKSDGERDFKISIDTGDRDFRFEIADNYISDFQLTVAHQPVGRFDLPDDSYWGYEVEEQDPNEIMHALVSDFAHLIPILVKFLDGFDSYELKSTDLGDHSIYLP